MYSDGQTGMHSQRFYNLVHTDYFCNTEYEGGLQKYHLPDIDRIMKSRDSVTVVLSFCGSDNNIIYSLSKIRNKTDILGKQKYRIGGKIICQKQKDC